MDARVKLAKSAAEHYVGSHHMPSSPISHDLTKQRACYVYIYQKPGHRIRAMYGRPLPQYRSLAQEIIANTLQALSHHSFPSVKRADLPTLAYSVGVLDPLQRISHPDQLEPARFGLYMKSDRGKTAVMLPQRPGIESAQDQIATALRESGISQRHEAITLYRFQVKYYE